MESIAEIIRDLEPFGYRVLIYADNTRYQIKRGEHMIADVPFYLLETNLRMLRAHEDNKRMTGQADEAYMPGPGLPE